MGPDCCVGEKTPTVVSCGPAPPQASTPGLLGPLSWSPATCQGQGSGPPCPAVWFSGPNQRRPSLVQGAMPRAHPEHTVTIVNGTPNSWVWRRGTGLSSGAADPRTVGALTSCLLIDTVCPEERKGQPGTALRLPPVRWLGSAPQARVHPGEATGLVLPEVPTELTPAVSYKSASQQRSPRRQG